MPLSTDARLKLLHFWDRNKGIISIAVLVIVLLILVNRFVGLNSASDTPTTTYAPTVSVLDDSEEVPDDVADSFEEFIDNYMTYLNNKDYVSAYNLISDDCKENYFGNSYNNYVNYVSEKYDSSKSYAIQSYSNYDDKYIYSVKVYDNFLATGLTNQSYRYVEEKMAAYYDEDGNIQINVANYMGSNDLQYQTSNDYLKIEVNKSIEKYSYIIYSVKLTNRSNYTIVLQDRKC